MLVKTGPSSYPGSLSLIGASQNEITAELNNMASKRLIHLPIAEAALMPRSYQWREGRSEQDWLNDKRRHGWIAMPSL